MEGSKDFIELPAEDTRAAFRVMERFSATVTDPSARTRLEDALRGKGAFRRFKDMAHRVGVTEAWYRFKAEALAQDMRDFLDNEEIAFDDDVASPAKGPVDGR